LLTLTIIVALIFIPINDNIISKTIDERPSITTEVHSGWSWLSYEVLSDSSNLGSTDPWIAIDSNDNLHIVWDDFTNTYGGADNDILYRFFDSTTKEWGSVELVSTESTSDSINPKIALDTSGNIHVAWLDATDYLSAGVDDDVFYKKKNYGGSWTTTTVISDDSTITCFEFDITSDAKDDVYIAWTDPTELLSSGSDIDIFGKHYDTSENSWSSLILLSPSSTAVSGYPNLVAEQNSGIVHLAWSDTTDILGADGDYDIFYKTWNATSSTLSSLELISTNSDQTSIQPFLQLDNENNIHIVWRDAHPYFDADTDTDVHYRYKDASTNIWSDIELVSTESGGASSTPKLVIDQENSLYVCWQDGTDISGFGTDYDVFFKYKHPSLGFWSEVQCASLEGDLDSYEPVIIGDSKGFIHLVYSELSNIGSSGADTDIFYRSFAGVPDKTSLATILPNPKTTMNNSLNWQEVISADTYSVYRSDSFIYSIADLDPLTSTTETNFYDTVNQTGTYYYAIVAENEYGFSSLSNVEYVTVESRSGILGMFDLTDLLILGGAILGLQILVSIVTIAIIKSSNKPTSKTKSGKKK
jgi:hypothetical protein